MTLHLSDDDVRAATDMSEQIAAIEGVLAEEADGQVVMPPRLNVSHNGTFLRLMPVFLGRSGLLGYKAFHGSMAQGVRYLVVLVRQSDGELLAVADAAYLTAARTGATSGVATDRLAPPGPAVVGLLGSGLEAETNLAAVAAVRPLSEVRVYSRNAERRTTFAAQAQEQLDVPVIAVASPTAAVGGATIVLVATNTGTNGPVAFSGEWIEPGQHVVSIGSTSPFLREIDPATFARADTVVFDAPAEQLFEESGDLMAVPEGERARLAGSARLLADLVANDGVPRRSADAVTLFKSVGTAAQDLVALKVAYERARELGLGRSIGTLAALKEF